MKACSNFRGVLTVQRSTISVRICVCVRGIGQLGRSGVYYISGVVNRCCKDCVERNSPGKFLELSI
jgi:hypothetical protein